MMIFLEFVFFKIETNIRVAKMSRSVFGPDNRYFLLDHNFLFGEPKISFLLMEGEHTYIHTKQMETGKTGQSGRKNLLEDFYFGLGLFVPSFAQFAQFAQLQSRFEVKQYSWYLR